MRKYLKSAQRVMRRIVGNDAAVESIWAGYTRDAIQLASIIDCAPEMLLQKQQHPERVAALISDRTCSWYLPWFDNPFYGGIMTILRLAEHLLTEHGIKQRFLICGAAVVPEVRNNLEKAFPPLAKSEVLVLDSGEALANIPPSDYSVATLWTTAYVLLGVQNAGYKFYMIQDFEPSFYPAGSTYAQAEFSYRFGFYGICNTQSLKEIYERDYGGCAEVLHPNIDRSIFHPGTGSRPSTPKRLFYYARPGTPRNGFELAAAALTRVKQIRGDSVDIVCAGAGWRPEAYRLEGIVRSVGMLPYEATGDLYRSCHAGFVMMMTKHPSYLPYELMACEATVVTNFNPANTWLLKDGENCLLSAPTLSCLADTLGYALDQHEALEPLRQRAADQILNGAGDWTSSLRVVADFMSAPPSWFHARQTYGVSFNGTGGKNEETLVQHGAFTLKTSTTI